MIAKGTTHNNGSRLAQYLIAAKTGERAELWKLQRFESENVKDAFRSVQIMAEGTRCELPFFHVQVRNRDGEHLTREQWERVANRIESKLGLTDQPRAIAFHQKVETGDEHMHVGWSRIDEETMTAKTLQFYKLRLKEVSRELESELGLTPVSNERRGASMAPLRHEDEQARRLGVDIHEVRETIRECWERSDTGNSFRAALSDRGLTLAKGDQRDFIAVDPAGGMHVLSKRILGNTAAQVRVRMTDLDRNELPTLEEAREQIARTRNLDLKPQTEAQPTAKQPEEQVAAPIVDEIRVAFQQARNAVEFSAALERDGFHLAVVNAADAENSREAHRGGEIVVISNTGEVHELSQNTAGASQKDVDKLIAEIDPSKLDSVTRTQEQLHLQTSRFIALTAVGAIPSPNAGIPIDFDRMLADTCYRREIEKQQRLERDRRRELAQTKQRSIERER